MSEGNRIANKLKIASDDNFTILAEEGQQTKGFDIVIIRDGKVIRENLAVDYKSRGLGIDTQLMKSRHEELRRRGITRYETGTNKGSRAILDKLSVSYNILDDNKTTVIKL